MVEFFQGSQDSVACWRKLTAALQNIYAVATAVPIYGSK